MGSMRDLIESAVQIFRANPEAGDDDILEKVIATGVDRPLATQLVALLPIAYGRMLLSKDRVSFSDYYICLRDNGKPGRTGRLACLPVWAEALDFATHDGYPPFPIASRSSEIRVANEALKDGKTLQSLVWSPPVFLWPVDSYRDPKKVWWQFWKA
jgi:hypothetical protein